MIMTTCLYSCSPDSAAGAARVKNPYETEASADLGRLLHRPEQAKCQPRICAFYRDKGRCKFGQACRFLHSDDHQTTPENDPASTVLQPPRRDDHLRRYRVHLYVCVCAHARARAKKSVRSNACVNLCVCWFARKLWILVMSR